MRKNYETQCTRAVQKRLCNNEKIRRVDVFSGRRTKNTLFHAAYAGPFHGPARGPHEDGQDSITNAEHTASDRGKCCCSFALGRIPTNNIPQLTLA